MRWVSSRGGVKRSEVEAEAEAAGRCEMEMEVGAVVA